MLAEDFHPNDSCLYPGTVEKISMTPAASNPRFSRIAVAVDTVCGLLGIRLPFMLIVSAGVPNSSSFERTNRYQASASTVAEFVPNSARQLLIPLIGPSHRIGTTST